MSRKKASIPMTKIFQETMAEEMDSLGFRLVQANLIQGITWVRLLDQNRVVQLYRIRCIPLRGEPEMGFILKPFLFPGHYGGVDGGAWGEAWCGIWDIELYLDKKVGVADSYPLCRRLANRFYAMRESKDAEEFEGHKAIYTAAIANAYREHAKPHFLRGVDLESSIAEYEKIAEIIFRPWQDKYGKLNFNFNRYYIGSYLYKLIYLGNGIDEYFDWVERYNNEFFDFYKFKCEDFDEKIARYKAKDVDYFMERYKRVQETNAEKLAAMLGKEKEEFPYIPPLKELKIR